MWIDYLVALFCSDTIYPSRLLCALFIRYRFIHMFKKINIAFATLVLPAYVLALDPPAAGGGSGGNNSGTIASFADTLITVVDNVIRIAFGLAIAAFFFGIAKYLFGSGDAKQDGKRIMIGGTIAIVIMLSIFGIAQFFQRSLGVSSTATTGDQAIPSIGRKEEN